MSQSIVFVTGNKRKLWQATEALEPYDITVNNTDLDIVEIQSHDPVAITEAKVRAAYEKLQKPIVVNDHSWNFPALNGFPGGYMKDINGWFTAEDFLALMSTKTDRRAILTERVAYFDGQHLELFAVDFAGKVMKEKRGIGHVPCEQVVVFDGDTLTVAEHIDRNEHARDIHQSAWDAFGKWFSQQ